MRLYSLVQGEDQPLIILHGFLGSSDNWRTMSKRLAARYRVFSIDLRNHGRSPHSEIMNYPMMAQDLGEFLGAHSLSSAVFLGHSMGGKVAMQFAGDFPGRVDKLVIVDIAPRSYPPSQRTLLTALQQLDLRAINSFADADAALAPKVNEASLRQFLIKNLVRDDDARFQWRFALDALASNYDELLKPVAVKSPFDKPALFLRAGRSRFIGETDVSLIRKNFPRAEIQTIDAGHWLHTEAPDEFYRVVNEFLAIE